MKNRKQEILKKFLYYVYQKKISSGPFREMKYISTAHGSAFMPKILGTYEKELQKFIPEIVQENYDLIIDVGAAEGYYAVGLAYLYKKTGNKNFQVRAYDTNLAAHSSINKLATLNNVQNHIEISTICNHEVLRELRDKKVFILCDIEGGETALLDPEKVKKLFQVDMLLELHDGKENYIADEFVRRFKNSHEIEIVHFNYRKPEEAPWWLLHPKIRLSSVREGRKKGLKWMFLKVKDRGITT